MRSPVKQIKIWYPPLTPKGARVVNDNRRYILLHGPRKTTKTITAAIKLCVHAYKTKNAACAILVKRKSAGKIGVWGDLAEVIERMFQRDGKILPWVKKPSSSSDTRMQMMSVRNCHGDVVPIYLLSAFNEKDIYDLMKSTRFSLIYISEADQFESDQIFHASADQLRVIGLPYESHQMVLDCNPPEEGELHWLYRTFIDRPEPSDEFAHYGFQFEDNPWLTPMEQADLRTRYSTNHGLYDRMVLGLWSASVKGTLFEAVFDEKRHVVGSASSTVPRSEWQLLLPARGTNELILGWDLGQTSHAVAILCKRMVASGDVAFDQIDEVVSINLQVSLKEFTMKVMEKMRWWEEFMLRNGSSTIKVRHWADTSSFEYEAGAGATPATTVFLHSNRTIRLLKVSRATKSRKLRSGMMERMYKDGLITHSAICKWTIGMAKYLRRKALTDESARGSQSQRRWTHPFDAITFGIASEAPIEMLAQSEPSASSIRGAGRTVAAANQPAQNGAR